MPRRLLVLSWFALKVGLRRSPKTVSAKAMLLALAVSLGMALGTGQALADQVNCGDTLTRNTRLHRDLNCAGSGLIIGADNVRLDLNGHTVAGADGEESVGIEVASRHGVTVRNGVIRNFQIGIRLTDARHALLRKLTLIDTSVFGVLMSLEPGAAALAGLVVLGQALDVRGGVALLMVSVASLGITLGHARADPSDPTDPV